MKVIDHRANESPEKSQAVTAGNRTQVSHLPGEYATITPPQQLTETLLLLINQNLMSAFQTD